MKKVSILLVISVLLVMISSTFATKSEGKEASFNREPVKTSPSSQTNVIETQIPVSDRFKGYTDVELIALLVMAEAEGEPEIGQRLVVDTVLNRVDSNHFPDTVRDVIYQPRQFSSMWNGRIDRCDLREDLCKLVVEEYERRLDYDVIFFNPIEYSKYGSPLYQIGNHYFSSYN